MRYYSVKTKGAGPWEFPITELREFSAEANRALQGESCKWAHHQQEMQALSMRFPHILFTLRGEGKGGDQWVKCFKDGRVQHCPNDGEPTIEELVRLACGRVREEEITEELVDRLLRMEKRLKEVLGE